MTELIANNTVSAKLIGGEEAGIIADFMQEKMPQLVVEDHESYLSLCTAGESLVFDMNELTEEMGFPYTVAKFLAVLTTYKGEICVDDHAVSIHVFAPEKSAS